MTKTKAKIPFHKSNPESFKRSQIKYYNKNKPKIKARQAKWHLENKERVHAKNAEWRNNNKDKIKLKYERYKNKQRALEIHRKYGITADVWNGFIAKQDDRCGICGVNLSLLTGRKLAIDHDHITGLIRGILCSSCNKLLGFAKDSICVLQAASNYIERMNPGVKK